MTDDDAAAMTAVNPDRRRLLRQAALGFAFAVALATGLTQLGQTFNPFAGEANFMLGAYLFEDMGGTGHNDAAPLIAPRVYLGAAASILALEASHARDLRTVLYEMGLGEGTARISAGAAALPGRRTIKAW
jgi:hypothetical protein